MISERTAAILIFILIGSCLFGLLLLAGLGGNIPVSFYSGIPFGAILGVGTWIYLSKTWDPANLQTKGGVKQANLNALGWVIIGGLALSRILPRLVGEKAYDLFVGASLTWLFLTMGYIVFQAWRHRHRN